MSTLRQRAYQAARSLKDLLTSSARRGDRVPDLRQAEIQLEEQRRELMELRKKVVEGAHTPAEASIGAENVIWIFGTARTGSTWLMRMVEDLDGFAVWREPYVGELFGRFYNRWLGERHFATRHFILSEPCKESWLKSLRLFVLREASVRFPWVIDEGYLVVKEPNGAAGVPLLTEAMPESRMIFLVRDPRDVVASSLDAFTKGSWLHDRRTKEDSERTAMFALEADGVVEKTASRYLRDIETVKLAYDAHEGPKVLVRYEDLRADTLGEMKRIYSTLGVPVDEEELARIVEKHSWENIPEEKKGEGKFHRKGKAGGWKEDLTPEQVATVERVTAPLLKQFYPDET